MKLFFIVLFLIGNLANADGVGQLRSSTFDKSISIFFEGAAAEEVYNSLAVQESRDPSCEDLKFKKSESVLCVTYELNKYYCSFFIDSEGVAHSDFLACGQ